MKVEHFIWGPTKKGYPDLPLAQSGNYNLHLYLGDLAVQSASTGRSHNLKEQARFLLVSLPTKDESYVGYALINNQKRPYLLLLRMFYKDGLAGSDRAGFVNHISILPRDALTQGLISLSEVNNSMELFEREQFTTEGHLESLEVPENQDIQFGYETSIKSDIDIGSVKLIARQLLKNKKIHFLWKHSSAIERFKIATDVVGLLNFRLKLPPISFMTERPASFDLTELFNFFVLPRSIDIRRDIEAWAFVRPFIDKSQIAASEEREEAIYSEIDKAFN